MTEDHLLGCYFIKYDELRRGVAVKRVVDQGLTIVTQNTLTPTGWPEHNFLVCQRLAKVLRISRVIFINVSIFHDVIFIIIVIIMKTV